MTIEELYTILDGKRIGLHSQGVMGIHGYAEHIDDKLLIYEKVGERRLHICAVNLYELEASTEFLGNLEATYNKKGKLIRVKIGFIGIMCH